MKYLVMKLIQSQTRAYSRLLSGRKLYRNIHTGVSSLSPLSSKSGATQALNRQGLRILENAQHHVVEQPPGNAHSTQELNIPSWEHWYQDDLLMSRCEKGSKLKIALLLSGGVDSSVALALLRAAGHDVRAFYLQIWFQEDFRNTWDACPWETDLEYGKQVCDMLQVPLEIVPFTNEYWERVVAHSIQEIKSGRTPNPDILCNSQVKFGAFYDFLEKSDHRFDRIASGHYANIVRSGNGPPKLSLTPDPIKDQTYFLANLSQEQLSRTLFPLGNLRKEEVRMLASAAQLPTQSRKDSQGICFLGKVKFDEFVKEHLGEWQGLIVEEETGRALGIHEGYWFYTLGQRTGLQLPEGPWYVVRKDTDWNVVYASKSYSSDDKARNEFYCSNVNWLQKPNSESQLYCKIRHGPDFYECEIEEITEEGFKVVLGRRDQGLAPGQYAAFYQDDVCLGCGVIETDVLCREKYVK